MNTYPLETRDTHFIIPGLATAHSHAFQRLLRGRTQRRASAARSFWSWRGLMYDLAERLDPDDIYAVARLAYAELAMSGVTAVGEFHYLHHDRNGRPYANRTETAEACIRAARDVGIRICLIRTGYMRGSHTEPLAPAQRRFADRSVELMLQDVESLLRLTAADPLVTLGVAAHSVRAMRIEPIRELADFAAQHALPFHMHICEQRQELAECVAEYGVTPVRLLAEHGALNGRFVGVHATHLSDDEIALLGAAGATVCLCRTTERDLGDGLPQTSALAAAGVRFCVGVDSHAEGNAFEEIRAVELDERSRLEARHVVGDGAALLEMGTRRGYAACGMTAQWRNDKVYVNRAAPSLVGIDDDHALDGIVFAATPEAVERVVVDGKEIVVNGRCPDWQEIAALYQQTVNKMT